MLLPYHGRITLANSMIALLIQKTDHRVCVTREGDGITEMPYLLMSTQIRLESGPTVVGDEWSDPALMEYLDATLGRTLGNNFLEWRTPDCPRVVLNKLEKEGYRVVSMTGINQTCVWTLHKPDTGEELDNKTGNMMLTAPPTRSESAPLSSQSPRYSPI